MCSINVFITINTHTHRENTLFTPYLMNTNIFTYRFEKKIVNRDADDSGFWLIMGVFGAEPRLHAFSYDVSAKKSK